MTEEYVDAERSFDRDRIAALFREFASAFESGLPLAFEGIDEGFVEFDPPLRASVEVELEAEKADPDDDEGEATVELEIELEWPASDVETGGPADEEVGEGGDAVDEPGAIRRLPDQGAVDENAIPVSASAVDTEAEGTGQSSDEPAERDAAGRRSRFEVYRDRADEYRWRLVHWNGNVIADSGEGYSTRANAVNGLRSVAENAPGARIEHQE